MVASVKNIYSLRMFFEPVSTLKFPEKILLLGSGQTRPKEQWLDYPSIRFNQKTLDVYPENEIFAVLTQILSFPKVKAHPLFQSLEHPYILHFLREMSLQKTEKTNERQDDPKIITIGTKEIHNCVYYHELHKRNKKFTTGSLLILFLLYSPIKEFYLAGFDGYRQIKDYFQVTGEKWVGWHHGHDLYGEWEIIEKAVSHARSIGKKVEIAKDIEYDDFAKNVFGQTQTYCKGEEHGSSFL